MLVKEKHYELISKVIDTWKSEKVISDEDSVRLKNSITLSTFDWKRLAIYSFWIAGLSLAISVFSLLLDDTIIKILKQIFRLPPMTKSIILGTGSAALYFWGFRRKKFKPQKQFSNEFLLFIGAIVTGAAIIFFGMAVGSGSTHYSILILVASVVYLCIGGLFPSSPMWVLGLVTFGSWFGTETGYVSGWGAYFLGMNYPLRFLLFGAVTITISLLIEKSRYAHIAQATFVMGLLYFFIALWIMSIFGNYKDTSWHAASLSERFIWSFLFGIAAIASIIWGLKIDNGIARGFGITFLFINFYTKFFEYFWNVSHKAIFFAVLAVSFWLAGRYSEKAFNALKGKLLEIPGDN